MGSRSGSGGSVGLGGAAGGAGAKQDTESHDLLELLDFKANKV